MKKEIEEIYNYQEIVEAKKDKDGWGYSLIKYEDGKFKISLEYRKVDNFSEHYKHLNKIFSTYEEAEKYAINYFNTELKYLKL